MLEPSGLDGLITLQAIYDLAIGLAVLWLLYRDWGS